MDWNEVQTLSGMPTGLTSTTAAVKIELQEMQRIRDFRGQVEAREKKIQAKETF